MANFENIKLIVLDVDGTLTDGGIYYDSQGNELKRFDVKDGLGIKIGIAAGLEFAIITGRESPMVERRAKELGIRYLIQGAQKKVPALLRLIEQHGCSADAVAYMGDDLNDLPVMAHVGICACPADAVAEVRGVCDFVADCNGGRGAVRNFIQEILQQRNLWHELSNRLYG